MRTKTKQEEKAALEKKIALLRGLKERDFALWQFFEKRADEIKGGLWTTVTWFVTLQGGLLAFILGERVTAVGGAGLGIAANVPPVMAALAGLGLMFTLLSWAVIGDIAGHVRENWKRASAAKGDYHGALRGGRIYILYPLGVVELFFAFAFGFLLFLAFRWSILDGVMILLVLATAVVALLHALGCFEERPEADSTPSGGVMD